LEVDVDQSPGSSNQTPIAEPPRRGRPPGSVALTPDIQQTIIAFIRAGAFDYIAAQAAGLSPRTFQDYMARGEGRHPTRRPTARLRAFAHAVRRAQAEARVVAETRVFQQRPHWWLTHAARTVPGHDGWTIPKDPPDVIDYEGKTFEERLAELADSPSD
jgi:hypothetical protein